MAGATLQRRRVWKAPRCFISPWLPCARAKRAPSRGRLIFKRGLFPRGEDAQSSRAQAVLKRVLSALHLRDGRRNTCRREPPRPESHSWQRGSHQSSCWLKSYHVSDFSVEVFGPRMESQAAWTRKLSRTSRTKLLYSLCTALGSSL